MRTLYDLAVCHRGREIPIGLFAVAETATAAGMISYQYHFPNCSSQTHNTNTDEENNIGKTAWLRIGTNQHGCYDSQFLQHISFQRHIGTKQAISAEQEVESLRLNGTQTFRVNAWSRDGLR